MPAQFRPGPFFFLLVCFFLTGPLSAQRHFSNRPTPTNQPPPREDSAAAPIILLEPEIALVERFDRDGDHRLDDAERQAARVYLANLPLSNPTPSGRPGANVAEATELEPVKPGERVNPPQTETRPRRTFFDDTVVHSVFLEFDSPNWEKDLADFAPTDVWIPARLIVDGQNFPDVGVHFHRTAGSAPHEPGYKRSLDIRLDYVHADQRLDGERQLLLRDSATDPTYLRAPLYSHIARHYVSAPLTNYTRVVINGESWGPYLGVQPFDANLVRPHVGVGEGARWIVRPGGTLAYLGAQPDSYRRFYELQTPENPAAWARLIRLCQILQDTPEDQLAAALAPYLDVDDTLRALAVETALINRGGYRETGGGYGLFLDPAGRFHFVPLEGESSFRLIEKEATTGGPNSGAGRGGGGVRGGRGPMDSREKGPATVTASDPREARAAELVRERTSYPKQAATDLAMLLAYSLVNKVDTNDDRKLTSDEWNGFARTWFINIDEDQAGVITLDQFTARMRLFVTPPSVLDGKTQQTFGRDDAAAIVARQFFAALDSNHDTKLSREEFTAGFGAWYNAWGAAPPKTLLTEDMIRHGLTTVLSQTIFQADQSYIGKDNLKLAQEPEREGGGRGGGHGGGGGGSGLNVGLPIPGLPAVQLGGHSSHGGGGGGPARLVHRDQLEALAGIELPDRPLMARLLRIDDLRAHYLALVNEIATRWLTWDELGPIAKKYHTLIADEVKRGTHKAGSYARFVQDLDQALSADNPDAEPSLKTFASLRREYLLNDEYVKKYRREYGY
jgi:hypothetical protein